MRKAFEVNRRRYIIVDGKREYADESNNPIILPPCPDKRYARIDGVHTKTPEWADYCTARDEAINAATYKDTTPIKLQFAHIDSKNCSVVHTNQSEFSRQPKTEAVLAIAQHEYLTRIHALQKELDEKYGSLLELEGSDVQPDEDLTKKANEVPDTMFTDLYYH